MASESAPYSTQGSLVLRLTVLASRLDHYLECLTREKGVVGCSYLPQWEGMGAKTFGIKLALQHHTLVLVELGNGKVEGADESQVVEHPRLPVRPT